jgi:hypothetical protein
MNDTTGSNSILWIFGLLILMAMMNGGGGWFGNGGYRPQYATQDFVQNGFNFNDLQDQNRDISNLVTAGTAQAVAATNQTFHDTIGALNDKYSELQRDIAALAVGQANQLAKSNECCCETKMLIAENSAAINLALANMEGRLTAKMDANTIQELRDKVGQLELSQATAGVLRYPTSWSYGAGPFPPFYGYGCGCPNAAPAI